ncbi:hypothetical protein GCM10025876_24260 [Demequina litorisediminis]|uniref:50S ribosomal protein L3 n=1 Tax=Demequina litorisediminis TaxID=1849022 RepID=A0ABQ6IEB9_9MICO|nr:hypothetical protein GCM10025876_24260 [Demequina litorisediminis]
MTTTSNAQRTTRALLGTKPGMTQVWDDEGRVVPVTVVQVDTNVVTQVRNVECDGYEAVQARVRHRRPPSRHEPAEGSLRGCRRHAASPRGRGSDR